MWFFLNDSAIFIWWQIKTKKKMVFLMLPEDIASFIQDVDVYMLQYPDPWNVSVYPFYISYYAPINVKPQVGGSRLPPGNLTFFGKPKSNSLPLDN